MIAKFNIENGVIKYEVVSTDFKLALPFGDSSRIVGKNEFLEFLRDRVVPSTRRNIKQVLNSMNMQFYDEFEIFKFNNGVSVDDQCWVKFEYDREDLCWSAVNPRLRNDTSDRYWQIGLYRKY